LLAPGVNLRVVMEILRQSQISLTPHTYRHVMLELQHDAAKLMNALLTKHEHEASGTVLSVDKSASHTAWLSEWRSTASYTAKKAQAGARIRTADLLMAKPPKAKVEEHASSTSFEGVPGLGSSHGFAELRRCSPHFIPQPAPPPAPDSEKSGSLLTCAGRHA
jgi:hypothetical protein